MRVRFPHRITRLGAAPVDVACFAPGDVSRGVETAFKLLAHHPLVAFWPKPKGRRDAGDEIKANIMYGVIVVALTAASVGVATPVAGLIASQVIDNGGIFVWDVLGRSGDLSKPGDLENAKRFVQDEFGKQRADQIRRLYQAKWNAQISDPNLKAVCATTWISDDSLKKEIDKLPPTTQIIGPIDTKDLDPFKQQKKVLETKPPAVTKNKTTDTPPATAPAKKFPWWLALAAIPFL